MNKIAEIEGQRREKKKELSGQRKLTDQKKMKLVRKARL